MAKGRYLVEPVRLHDILAAAETFQRKRLGQPYDQPLSRGDENHPDIPTQPCRKCGRVLPFVRLNDQGRCNNCKRRWKPRSQSKHLATKPCAKGCGRLASPRRKTCEKCRVRAPQAARLAFLAYALGYIPTWPLRREFNMVDPAERWHWAKSLRSIKSAKTQARNRIANGDIRITT